MTPLPVFLSLVVVVRNQADALEARLVELSARLAALASDHELIVVDNASDDHGVAVLKRLTGEDGLPNLQVYVLTREVDDDTATWAGIESALGDFVAVVDPELDDLEFLPQMLDEAAAGADLVFAANEHKPVQSLPYRACFRAFHSAYKWLNGVDLAKDAPRYRIVSKRVVNFVLQHSVPVQTWRHLPATGGFVRAHLSYSTPLRAAKKRRLRDSIDRGMAMLVSSTRGPMRLVTLLSLFGALANLVYSAYVIAIWIWKTEVAPGWVTLSLQQSGMFFLISLVLLVLGEYVLHMARLSNEGPAYHVAQELTSAVMTRRERLNVEVAQADGARAAPARPEPRRAAKKRIV